MESYALEPCFPFEQAHRPFRGGEIDFYGTVCIEAHEAAVFQPQLLLFADGGGVDRLCGALQPERSVNRRGDGKRKGAEKHGERRRRPRKNAQVSVAFADGLKAGDVQLVRLSSKDVSECGLGLSGSTACPSRAAASAAS